MSPPSVALVINTHEQPEYLRRVLAAVSRQTTAPAEVVLADDGSGGETRRVFAEWAAAWPGRTHHAWQEAAGFRRSRILNAALAHVTAEWVVFLDGDTLPHPRFIADHQAQARLNRFTQGHRCLVEREAAEWFGQGDFARDRWRAWRSGQLSGGLRAFRWPLPWWRTRRDLRGIRGCNLGIWRADLIRVNGYNEAFEGWGREDSELAVRLMNSGVLRRDVRGRCLCYHLWHPPADRSRVAANDALLDAALRTRATRCEPGLDRHRPVA